MLAKITAKNQLTLPKSLTQAVGATEYFDVEVKAGQLILTPVRIQRGDAVRAKLAELHLTQDDLADAVTWARSSAQTRTLGATLAAEHGDSYDAQPVAKKKKASAKGAARKATSKA